MDMNKIDETVTDVFRTLFRQPGLELRDEMTTADVAGWDSLRHVSLIIHLEQEFEIKFRGDEVVRLTNVGELLSLIHEKLAGQPASQA